MASTKSSVEIRPWTKELIDELSAETKKYRRHKALIVPHRLVPPGMALVCKSVVQNEYAFVLLIIHRR